MNHNQNISNSEREEYRQIKNDLIFVVLLNAVLFAALIALYFYNRSTGSVDSFFASLLKF